MTSSSVKKNKSKTQPKPAKKIILISLCVMLGLLIAWHLLFPLLGLSVEITTNMLGIAIATILLICIATLLFYILTGIAVLMLGLGVFIWTILAIIFFPLLFPILIPILLLMFVIGLIAGK